MKLPDLGSSARSNSELPYKVLTEGNKKDESNLEEWAWRSVHWGTSNRTKSENDYKCNKKVQNDEHGKGKPGELDRAASPQRTKWAPLPQSLSEAASIDSRQQRRRLSLAGVPNKRWIRTCSNLNYTWRINTSTSDKQEEMRLLSTLSIKLNWKQCTHYLRNIK